MDDYTLFDLEKDYHLGNYQSCINKASSMQNSRESRYYMCLSYCHLKKYDILESEISKSSDQCVKLIRHLMDYEKKHKNKSEIISKLDSMLEDESIDVKDDLSRLIISSIYSREKQYSNALKVLHRLDTLASMLAQINIYISMNQIGLAVRHLKLMQNKDDYATLTLLAVAVVKLVSGSPVEAYDIATELEEKYRATPLLLNIQTAAAILNGNLDTAKEHCENSLDLDNDNLEGLINMLFILSKTRGSNEIKDRYLSRLRTLYPDHEYVKDIDRLEIELRG